MSFIYTHNTSPRRFKKVIKNKSYYEAVDKQNKLLNSDGQTAGFVNPGHKDYDCV